MRKLFLSPLFLLFVISTFVIETAQAQELTTFILVRHAEKVDDGTKDPAISEEGKLRAQRLADHLENTSLTAIYSTPYRRTQSTVRAIAGTHNLEIQAYDPFADNMLNKMLESNRGGIILISGHSNTTPHLVNRLIGKEKLDQLEESDYDNLFIVTVTEIGKGKLVRLTY
ncbi:MAG: SixA phosphatase family protein [Candidatus Halalkalibacterium sp. M3_1C_030]